jgi:hypothetical protein
MTDAWLTWWLRRRGGVPCFQIHGKARAETSFRTIDVYATHRRDAASRWPLWRGTCITWTSQVIVVGWDFAAAVLRDPAALAANPREPVAVAAGRIRDSRRRLQAGASPHPSAAEVLAHECGHTWQALRLRAGYLPSVGALTLFREGDRFWNYFENQASEEGLFGGLIAGSQAPFLTPYETAVAESSRPAAGRANPIALPS